MSGLSAVIITRNEEKNLPRCLESLAFVDEIIIVDSQSTDRTIEVAREYGARVLSPEWQGFGIAKQTGVGRAEGKWILSIDADEVVQSELAREIQAVVADPGTTTGYYIPRRTAFLGRWIMHSGWYPDYVLRLFRKDSGKFTEALVHETVLLEGLSGRLQNDLLHYSYPDLETYFEKFNRYTTLAAKGAHESGRKSSSYDLVIRPLAKFIKQYVTKRGFLDGIEGLVLAVLSSCYVMVKYAKLRHLTRAGNAEPTTLSEHSDIDHQYTAR